MNHRTVQKFSVINKIEPVRASRRTGKDVDPDEGYSVKFNGTVPTVVQAEEPNAVQDGRAARALRVARELWESQ